MMGEGPEGKVKNYPLGLVLYKGVSRAKPLYTDGNSFVDPLRKKHIYAVYFRF